MAGWRDFAPKPIGRTADAKASQGMALDYDKNGVPVLSHPVPVQGVDQKKSVIGARPSSWAGRPASRGGADALRQNGNANPDYMLGKLMNPILIAPSFSAGVPMSAMQGVVQAGCRTFKDPIKDLVASGVYDLAEALARRNGGR